MGLILIIFIFSIGIVVLGVIVSDRQKKKERQSLEKTVFFYFTETVQAHIEELSLKRKQLLYKDSYGIIQYDKWSNEKHYFFHKVAFPGSECPWDCETVCTVPDYSIIINKLVDNYEASNPSSDFDEEKVPDDPIDYEIYCKNLLEQNGWDARITKGSGDQGIDIIATRDGTKAVFQCKKYTSPVGNKAVQEIIAGRLFEKADIAVVISNASFTTSAQELANAANVLLLHHSELKKGDSFITKGSKDAKSNIDKEPIEKIRTISEQDGLTAWFKYRSLLLSDYYRSQH